VGTSKSVLALSAFIGVYRRPYILGLLCDSVIQPSAEKPKQNSMAADKRR
jgi:hypothetical protein